MIVIESVSLDHSWLSDNDLLDKRDPEIISEVKRHLYSSVANKFKEYNLVISETKWRVILPGYHYYNISDAIYCAINLPKSLKPPAIIELTAKDAFDSREI